MSYWTRKPIDTNRMLKRVSSPRFGGTTLFVGSVRAGPEDGPVEKIEYTAYEAMLDKEFDRIVGEAKSRWPDVKIDASHRLGTVPVGEASIVVIAAAPHRDEAFAACRYVIEEVKKRLPVWKKEILSDGRESWRPNRSDDLASETPISVAPPPSH